MKASSMNVLIAGGTGFIGTYLMKRFESDGHMVSVVSRGTGQVNWQLNSLVEAMKTTDVLINLAGKNINCRHNNSNKEQIRNSRIDTTRLLGEAIVLSDNKSLIWFNASASAIYAPGFGKPNTETKFVLGNSFLSKTVVDWETEFFACKLKHVRQVALRTVVVLGAGGGAFVPLKILSKTGLGGNLGSGKQLFSWIHIEDYYRAILFLIENSTLKGAVNLSSPGIISQSGFMKLMRKYSGMPLGLPAPAFFVKIAAAVIGTESALLLDSVNEFPEVLLSNGFQFLYPDAESAIADLLKK